LGAFALPLLGAGVAQAVETADLPENCTSGSATVQCQGDVALKDLLEYFAESVTGSGIPLAF
ncbi:hypothetical protein, partial [Aldersonia kunmingensis]|uniref:hypothetical protein n=1 Tax=Aldersonia kunmingensis TaxID=408066 RepID=UPI000ADB365C